MTPMDEAWRLLKTDFAPDDEERPEIGRTLYNPETNQVLGSSLRIMPTSDGRHNQPENVIRDLIHEDMHAATLPELSKPKLYGQVIKPNVGHAEFPAFLGQEIYSQRLARGEPTEEFPKGKPIPTDRRREPYHLEGNTPITETLYRVASHPNVPKEQREGYKQEWRKRKGLE